LCFKGVLWNIYACFDLSVMLKIGLTEHTHKKQDAKYSFNYTKTKPLTAVASERGLVCLH